MPCLRCGKYDKDLINYEAPRKYSYLCFSYISRLLSKLDEESYFLFHLHLQEANINNPILQMRLQRLSDFFVCVP